MNTSKACRKFLLNISSQKTNREVSIQFDETLEILLNTTRLGQDEPPEQVLTRYFGVKINEEEFYVGFKYVDT